MHLRAEQDEPAVLPGARDCAPIGIARPPRVTASQRHHVAQIFEGRPATPHNSRSSYGKSERTRWITLLGRAARHLTLPQGIRSSPAALAGHTHHSLPSSGFKSILLEEIMTPSHPRAHPRPHPQECSGVGEVVGHPAADHLRRGREGSSPVLLLLRVPASLPESVRRGGR